MYSYILIYDMTSTENTEKQQEPATIPPIQPERELQRELHGTARFPAPLTRFPDRHQTMTSWRTKMPPLALRVRRCSSRHTLERKLEDVRSRDQQPTEVPEIDMSTTRPNGVLHSQVVPPFQAIPDIAITPTLRTTAPARELPVVGRCRVDSPSREYTHTSHHVLRSNRHSAGEEYWLLAKHNHLCSLSTPVAQV